MRFHTELHASVRLQDFNDLDDIVGTGIAARPEHAMHAFVGLLELFCQLLECDRRVDVIAKKNNGVRSILFTFIFYRAKFCSHM